MEVGMFELVLKYSYYLRDQLSRRPEKHLNFFTFKCFRKGVGIYLFWRYIDNGFNDTKNLL